MKTAAQKAKFLMKEASRSIKAAERAKIGITTVDLLGAAIEQLHAAISEARQVTADEMAVRS